MALKVAVVGSRSFPLLDTVRWFVGELPDGVVVVSGGADGVDTAAAQAVKARGLQKTSPPGMKKM